MTKKKVYQKPTIQKVKLMPDEAVLTGCKSSVGSNRQAGKCMSLGNCKSNVPAS